MVSFEAWDPDNALETEFQNEKIHELTAKYGSTRETAIGKANEVTNTMHLMRVITLDEPCMICHGDPAVYEERDEEGLIDVKDALGFRYESWGLGSSVFK